MQRKKEAVAAATVAAIVAAALVRRRRGAHPAGASGTAGTPAPHVISHSSSTARNAKLASVGAKAGGNFAVHRARRVFASAERRDELDRNFELKTATQVAEALGHMKGAMMKLGQMASYLDQGLPDHVREALAELQQDAPPMSPELAAGVVRAELGADPDQVFASWDPTPIASASIGQVHRAMTRDDRAVAVKVQYPGVDTAVGSDLDNVGVLFAGMGQLFPGFDHKPFVEELKLRLVEELDYTLEADHQRFFAAHYADHPYIHVPQVLDELSSRRVLTTELAEGVAWDEVIGWEQSERDLAAETLYRFAFGSLYGLRAFNGDPHPGNYLFRPGGQVTFLDFGLVKHFTEAEVDSFGEMIHHMVIEPDAAAFRGCIEDLGLLRADEPFTDEEVVDYFGHFYEFVLDEDELTITPEYASESIRRYFDQRGPFGEIMKAANLPPEFVIIQRINLGLFALFGELHARANWRRLADEIWPFVTAGPATPMGETIAAWEADRVAD